MTTEEILALMTLVSSNRPMSARQVGETIIDSASVAERYEGGRKALIPLVMHGAVVAPFTDSYSPTEKGRIAAALLMAKDPGLRVAFFDE